MSKMSFALLMFSGLVVSNAIAGGGPEYLPAWGAQTTQFNSADCSGPGVPSPFYTDFPIGTCVQSSNPAYGVTVLKSGSVFNPNVTSMILQCNTVNTGSLGFTDETHATCSLQVPNAQFDQFCLVDNQIPGQSYKVSCRKYPSCQPNRSLNKAQCQSRLNMCTEYSAEMKWLVKS